MTINQLKKPSTPSLLIILDILAVLLLIIAFWLVLNYAPVELEMGMVQKVFYFHVATGWTGMLGFLIATIAAVIYLKNHKMQWDIAGLAGIEIGMVFMALCIISGSFWARPIWNTWWTWDPRLTTALVMELVYAAYLLLRSGVDDPTRRARFAAVYAIIGFLSVPLTFLSIRIFRTIHPVIIGSSDPSTIGSFAMTGRMQFTFFFCLFTFTIIFAAFYWHRYRLGKSQKQYADRLLELNSEVEE
jgi:heme exporter protein C